MDLESPLFWSFIVMAVVGVPLVLIHFKQRRKLIEDAGPGAEIFSYQGGHPLFPQGGEMAIARQLAALSVSMYGTVVEIPLENIVSLSLESQSVNTGGGRSVGGAIAGGILFGPIGAVVGSQKPTNVVAVERVVLVVKHGPVQVQMIFSGGAGTQSRLASLLA